MENNCIGTISVDTTELRAALTHANANPCGWADVDAMELICADGELVIGGEGNAMPSTSGAMPIKWESAIYGAASANGENWRIRYHGNGARRIVANLRNAVKGVKGAVNITHKGGGIVICNGADITPDGAFMADAKPKIHIATDHPAFAHRVNVMNPEHGRIARSNDCGELKALINADELAAAADNLTAFANLDEMRPKMLASWLFTKANETLTGGRMALAAADGFCLAIQTLRRSSAWGEWEREEDIAAAWIPIRAINSIARAAKKKRATSVSIYKDGHTLTAMEGGRGERKWQWRYSGGELEPYGISNLIPNGADSAAAFTCGRRALADAIRLVRDDPKRADGSQYTTPAIRFGADGGEWLRIYATPGMNEPEILCEQRTAVKWARKDKDGEPVRFALNANYALKCLEAAGGELVEIIVASPQHPVIIRGDWNSAMLMPMFVNWRRESADGEIGAAAD